MTPDKHQKLASFLRHEGPPPDLARLREHRLAAYAYCRPDVDDALKRQLRPDYLRARALHLSARVALLPLLEAWRRAGVEALVFKGFYLAEWVYEDSAARPYNDADLLIRPQQLERAARLAGELGWVVAWSDLDPGDIFGYRRSATQAHEVMHLQHPDAPVSLDVHRRILHNRLPYTRLQERYTEAAWQSSQIVLRDGAELRVLHPVDALLMGLVLNRCWSDDAWRLRGRDFLDFQALVARFGPKQEDLLLRAMALGCERTLRLFLRRCDAFEGTLDLRPPGLFERQRWNLLITPERGNPGLEHSLARLARVPGLTRHTLRELPGVIESLRALRASSDPIEAAKTLERAISTPHYPSYDQWDDIRQGVQRALSLLGVAYQDHKAAQQLALYNALQRVNCPVKLEPFGQQLELILEGQVLELD